MQSNNRPLLLPGVSPEMLCPEFWCSRFPDRQLRPDWFKNIIISDKVAVKRYYANLKTQLSSFFNKDGSRLTEKINDLENWCQPGHGLIVWPADLKLIPRQEPFFSTSEPSDLDRNQLSGLDPGDAVMLFAVSPDEEWFGVVSDAGTGWVKRDAVGIGNPTRVKNYLNEPLFLTAIEPNSRILSDGQIIDFSMGCTFPLRDQARRTVLIPGRNSKGNLKFKTGIIIEDTVEGYLPKTAHHLIKQGFKYLGYPYAWGDRDREGSGRDCSRLIKDVLRTMGFKPPRNSRDQLKAGQNRVSLSGKKPSERLARLKGMSPGSLLFTSSHVMIYLGECQGECFALHALYNYRRIEKNKEEVITVKQVVVSGLSLGDGTGAGSLMEQLTEVIEV